MYKIHLLPATFGDSILIEYGSDEPHYILIDGGPYYVFDDIMKAIRDIAPGMKKLELVVATRRSLLERGAVRIDTTANGPPRNGSA